MEMPMKAKKVLIIMCALAIILPIIVYGGNSSKRGTAGAVELLMPVGARGMAMSGAVLSDAMGVDALYWNPAGLARGVGLSGIQAMFSHTGYIADINIEYFAIGMGVGNIGSIGFSLKSIGFGTIIQTSEDFPDGTGATFTPNFLTMGLTYSKELTDRISIGFTGKLVSETIVRTSAQGFAFDAGVVYTVGANSILKGLKFGITLKNIGPNMQFDGGDLERKVIPPDSDPQAEAIPLKVISQSFDLPSTFDLGISYEIVGGDHKLVLATGFQNSNFGDDIFRLGAEYSFSDLIFVRVGYAPPDGSIDNQIQRMTFGGGIHVPFGNTNVVIDYAYTQVQVFDPYHTITFHLGF
jgi:hypothetical protein